MSLFKDMNAVFKTVHKTLYLINTTNLTLQAPTSQNHQTHSNNSSAVCRQIA